MSHAIGRARGLTYGLTALLTLGLLAGSPGVAVASPDSVDRVVSTIAKNIDAGSWKVAAANIDALDKTIRIELVDRKQPVTLPSNPVDARLAAVQQRLQDLKAEFSALNDALIAAQKARGTAAKQAINDIGGELIAKLDLIRGGKLAPVSAIKNHNAKIIAADFARLRSLNAAIRYLDDLMDSLKPAIRAAQKERAQLLALKTRMDKVIATYTPAGLTVAGTTTAPAAGSPSCSSWTGHWSDSSGGIDMIQNGDRVEGTYPYHNGRLTGTVSGRMLTGTWTEYDNSGTFTLTMSADGRSYSGPFVITAGAGAGGSVPNYATRTCSG